MYLLIYHLEPKLTSNVVHGVQYNMHVIYTPYDVGS